MTDGEAEPPSGVKSYCVHCHMTIFYDKIDNVWRHEISRRINCDNLPPVGWGR